MGETLTFSIKETATQSGLTEDTIRYYEKIGLLPRAERKQNSHRMYRLEDVETMRMIACFKKNRDVLGKHEALSSTFSRR